MSRKIVEIFVAKDRIAMAWFLIAVISIGLAAWYARDIVIRTSKKPQFFILDQAGNYYVSTAMDFEQARDIHAEQTRVAMETLFNRNPGGLDNPERAKRLFAEEATKQIADLLKSEKSPFSDQQIHQKVEIGEIKVLRTSGTQVVSSATGQIIRVGNFQNKQFTVVYEVTARFRFVLNPDMRRNGRFPTVCVQFDHKLVKKAES